MSTRDALTGALRRDQWDRLVEEASSRASDRAHGAWAALIDIDNFKRFNLHNGHVVADQVLVKLAAFLLALGPDGGVQVLRTGGDRFALVSYPAMKGSSPDGRATCERIQSWARDAMTPEQLDHCGDPHCIGPTRLTVSIAVAPIEPGEDPASLRDRLTTTLSEAKRAGRDRVLSG